MTTMTIMTNHSKCGERESLVALVYDECEESERHRLEAHVHACAMCAEELLQLRATHTALAAWPVAEPDKPIVQRLGSELRPWRLVQPDDHEQADREAGRSRRVFSVRWAQAAAAVLVLGASLAIANIEIKFASDGVVVRTGWQKSPIEEATRPTERVATGPLDRARGEDAASAPWRADLATLERQLRNEFSVRPFVEASTRNVSVGSSRPGTDGQLLQRLRQLIDDSERRQQRELALRVAQVVREVEAQRRGDLARIEQGFGRLEGVTGQEALRQRELLNYLVRVSQRQ
jgi:hypothetical protein